MAFDHYGTGPLRVSGGIAVRNKRGQIGEEWWSRRFLAVLEALNLGGRLTRGRTYARQGQVLSLAIEPGVVRADVQGSRTTPYAVRLTVPAVTEPQWAQVEESLAAAALYRAALLAGELPPEIEQVFADCGTPLFPTSVGMKCSCPDWSVPCKHVAAVCYVLAEAFDDDPFLVLAWRGRDQEALLDALRRTTVENSAPSWSAGVADRPLADCVDAFWAAADETPPPRSAVHPGAGDALVRTLTPLTATVRGTPLMDLLGTAYTMLTADPEEDRPSDRRRPDTVGS
ncbi:SWIM zinc finger family protein [Cryptosporangium sp. NPDC048952]|uniref:SWIM zinc finger family protein n=1 Tax=Cryptosporangium sp. NPDC048952 TaxID=3363961 RepID=UPI0037235953